MGNEIVSIERIDKKKADSILQNNTMNRKIVRANVDFIKSEITSGNFALNGSSIVISEEGILIDGQHRLLAISELDTVVNMVVVRNAKKEVFATIDCGKIRTAGDVISSEKMPYANAMASAIKRIIEEFSSKRKTAKNGTVKLSNSEILKFYKDNSTELIEIMERCTQLYSSQIKVTTPSIATAMVFLLRREDSVKAFPFIREIFTGEKETESNAALTLRKRLLNSKIDGIRIDDSRIRALFLVSFRAYKAGRNISKIVINKNLSQYLFKQL